MLHTLPPLPIDFRPLSHNDWHWYSRCTQHHLLTNDTVGVDQHSIVCHHLPTPTYIVDDQNVCCPEAPDLYSSWILPTLQSLPPTPLRQPLAPPPYGHLLPASRAGCTSFAWRFAASVGRHVVRDAALANEGSTRDASICGHRRERRAVRRPQSPGHCS